MRYILTVLFLISMAALVSAQRQVTNADLEKYRVERERAEREYRETYAKRGFPSPEELARRRQQTELDNQELVLELRERALAAEQLREQRRSITNYYTVLPADNVSPGVEYPYVWSFGQKYRLPTRTKYGEPGYFAGGQFWPTPVRRPQPKPNWTWPR